MLKVKLLLISLLYCFYSTAQDDIMPDFTVTDTDGTEHTLYEDYLENGSTVVIKLFFVGCPPCSAIAPEVQALYELWGEGDYDVQFFEMSTRSGDSDGEIDGYLDNLEVTIPAVGMDGGGIEAIEPLVDGDFGAYFGTPAFAVIDSLGEVTYFKSTSTVEDIHEAILETGAEGPGFPASYSLRIVDIFDKPIEGVSVLLKDQEDPAVEYTIELEEGNLLNIFSLEEEYPGINNPIISLSKTDGLTSGVSGLDLLAIQKHILNLEVITDPNIIIAADANGSNSISALDLISIQKIILGIDDSFPNGVESWKFLQSNVPIDFVIGTLTELEFTAIKIGNVNGS